MKKLVLSIILLTASVPISYAGSQKFVAYVPAPSGMYDRLRFVPRAPLTGPCDLGTVYFDSTAKTFKSCQYNTALSINEWSPFQGVWKQSSWLQSPGVTSTAAFLSDPNPDIRVGIGTSTPPFKLTINGDGGILAIGAHSTGVNALPAIAQGPGTRLLWFPYKSAFRVGITDTYGGSDGKSWDDVNIGFASMALGQNNKAQGVLSTILGGANNEALGQKSVVAGGGGNHSLGDNTFIGGGTGNYAGNYAGNIGVTSVGDNLPNTSSVVGGLANSAQGYASGIVAGNMNYTAYDVATGVNSQFSIIGGGQRNTTIGNFTGVLGGKVNKANKDYSAVVGGLSNTAKGKQSFVGGGGVNWVSTTQPDHDLGNIAAGDFSVITGGETNHAESNHSAISGGKENDTFGEFSTIGGGANNSTGDRDAVSTIGTYATVAGGYSNRAEANNSAIGGGQNNKTSGMDSTVGGGHANEASGRSSTVAGGGPFKFSAVLALPVNRNTAAGDFSAISGGQANLANGDYSNVNGGGPIVIPGNPQTLIKNIAGGDYSVVSGGQGNQALAVNSAVNGGYGNTAGGKFSVAAGGESNSTDGDHSWVGGKYMQLNNAADNTFVWGNAAAAPGVPISAANAFLVFPYGNAGRMGLGTIDPKTKLQVTDGDVYIETQGRGIILRDNTNANTCYRLTVNAGAIVVTPLAACP